MDTLLQGLGRGWRYYSSLAILATTTRDLASEVFHSWKAVFGVRSAVDHATKLMPKCISGRWRSIENTEDRLLENGLESWQKVLTPILLQKLELDEEDAERLLLSLSPQELQIALGSKKAKSKSKKAAKSVASAHCTESKQEDCID